MKTEVIRTGKKKRNQVRNEEMLTKGKVVIRRLFDSVSKLYKLMYI